MQELKYKPVAFWLLDGTSPFSDKSGYGASGTLSGPSIKGLPLTPSATASQYFDKSSTGSFSAPIFQNPSSPFSVSTVVRPVRLTEAFGAQTYRENLFTNPSFEVDSTGWTTPSATGFTSFAADGVNRGIQSFQFSGASNTAARLENVTTLTPGTYTVSAYFKVVDIGSGVAPSNGFGQVMEAVSGNVLAAGYNGTIVTTATFGVWQRNQVTFTLPDSGTPTVDVRIRWRTGGYTVRFDAMKLEKGAVATDYFDGSMPGYEWAGTANNSISRTRKDVSLVNRAIDPTLEGDSGTSANSGIAGRPQAANYVMTIDNTVFHSGASSRKTTKDATASPTISNVYILPASAKVIRVTPGETVSMGVWVRAGQTCQSRITATFRDNASTNLSPSIIGTYVTIPANTWTLVKLENMVVPDNANLVFATVIATTLSGNTSGGETFWVDSVMVNSGSTLSPFFYGGSVGAVWNGTVNSSESLMITSQADQQILSHSNQYDGLVLNNNTVSFSTAYTNSGVAECEYEIDYSKVLHIVATHTKHKNTLYINGEPVAEVDITPEQQDDTYVATGSLVTGNSISSAGLLMNNLAVFNNALTNEAVLNIYTLLNRRAAPGVPKSYNGKEIFFNRGVRPHYLNRVWDSADDYEMGVLDGVTMDGNELWAQKTEDGLTISGVYRDSVPLLHDLTADNIDSINMDWTGKNITVETSLDTVTWYPATRATNLSNIPVGFNPSSQNTLYIRISFKSGVEESYLSNMRVDGYLQSTVAPLNDRTRTFVNAVNLNEHEPGELSDDWGVKLINGSLSVSADASASPETFRTMEIWAKSNGPITQTGLGGSTVYTNGVLGNVYLAGQWVVYHWTWSTDQNPAFSLSGPNLQIGKIALYPTTLTATQISDIVRNYTGIKTVTSGSAGAMTLTEPVISTTFTARDWAVLGVG